MTDCVKPAAPTPKNANPLPGIWPGWRVEDGRATSGAQRPEIVNSFRLCRLPFFTHQVRQGKPNFPPYQLADVVNPEESSFNNRWFRVSAMWAAKISGPIKDDGMESKYGQYLIKLPSLTGLLPVENARNMKAQQTAMAKTT